MWKNISLINEYIFDFNLNYSKYKYITNLYNMINKGVLIIFLIFGIILVVIELVRVDTQCGKQRIIYRYLPRSFAEEQDEPVWPSQIFKAMFTQPSAWIRGIDDYDYRKSTKVNQFYISQM